jgi:hypothetical protein
MVSSIKNYFFSQMWVHDDQKDSHDIAGGIGDISPGGDANILIQNVQGNLSHLMHKIPMAQVEDLPEAMQR